MEFIIIKLFLDSRLDKLSEKSLEEATTLLTTLLEEYGKSEQQLLIVVDAVNQVLFGMCFLFFFVLFT